MNISDECDTTDRPLICAACGGRIEDGQRVEWPMPPYDPATAWPMHADIRDCWQEIIATPERDKERSTR